MDNLTHSLTGAFLSRAGLNRLTPDATWILVLAANAPDVDVVSALGGPALALHWHRGITHSLAFSPVLAFACVLLLRAFSRRNTNWMGATFVAWLGVLSHIALDLTNNYGVRILEPFSRQWFQWDLSFVVDPWIWVALLFALGFPLLARLLSSEMGEHRRAYPRRGWAIFALAFLLLYDGARAVLHARAIATLESRDYDGETSTRVAAFPTPLNPFVWSALVETPGRVFLYDLDLNRSFDPRLGAAFYRNDPGAALPALRAQTDFGELIAFAQYPLWRVVDDANNSRYTLTDLRFGDPVAHTFTCSARVVNLRNVADERCDFSFAQRFSFETQR